MAINQKIVDDLTDRITKLVHGAPVKEIASALTTVLLLQIQTNPDSDDNKAMAMTATLLTIVKVLGVDLDELKILAEAAPKWQPALAEAQRRAAREN